MISHVTHVLAHALPNYLEGCLLSFLIIPCQDDGSSLCRLIHESVIIVKHVHESTTSRCDDFAAVPLLPLAVLVLEAHRLLVWRLHQEYVMSTRIGQQGFLLSKKGPDELVCTAYGL